MGAFDNLQRGSWKGSREANSPEILPGERLEFWKEIAVYLKRDVRTVQRWEKLDGLPIYRHGPGRLGGVYSYKPELDGWWASARGRAAADGSGSVPGDSADSGPSPEPVDPAPDPDPARPAWWRSLAGPRRLIAAGIVLMILSAVALLSRRFIPLRVDTSALTFQARDWVLIAKFDNRTGDAALDGVLEYALERELANSRHVNVVPRERINDALRLMKRPFDTVVDAAVGREICLRDGGIRVLVTGRIERFGSTLLLSGTIAAPEPDHVVIGLSEEAGDVSEVLPAIRRLSGRIRKALGEGLHEIQESERKLERATTPSLNALRLYTQAMNYGVAFKWAPAEGLLQQAVEEDPDFASAHILLAWALRNQRQPPERYLPHAERALRLADRTGDRERHFIRGSYYSMTGRDAEALPTNQLAQFTAAVCLATRLGDLERANVYVQRTRTLLSVEPTQVANENWGWITYFPAYKRWVKGDIEGALRERNRYRNHGETRKQPASRSLVLPDVSEAAKCGRSRSLDSCAPGANLQGSNRLRPRRPRRRS